MDNETRDNYTKLYEKLRTANRRLLLTGTPIFKELSDLSFAINLAVGDDILPYNQRLFMDQFTVIEKGNSFWRGHFTESLLLLFALPFAIAGIPLAFMTPAVTAVGGAYFATLAGGFMLLPIINAAAPLNKVPLRFFSAKTLGELSRKYVSYFQFDKLDPNFPTQTVKTRFVDYNEDQSNFFLDFADLSLSNEQLDRMKGESAYNLKGNTVVESTAIQNSLANVPDSGREIGNFQFVKDKKLIESPKFLEILKVMGKNPQGIVIYSNYFENGVKLFGEFLDRHGFAGKYAILKPDFPEAKQLEIIDAYNSGKLPILLLHPVFTEGISLKGTRQLHILESIPSQAIFEQVIGRAVRFASHTHLPIDQRHVNVYSWGSSFSGYSATLAKNKNWGKRFNEVNSVAAFGTGMAQIDPNFMRKQMAPDEFAHKKREILKNGSDALKKLFSKYSIEENLENEKK